MLNRSLSTPQQQQYIRKCFDKDMRIDGRKNNEYRSTIIKNAILDHLPGSAYSYINHHDVEIYVGIKAKVEKRPTSNYDDLIKLEMSCMQKLDEDEVEEMNLIERLLQKSFVDLIT